MKDPEYKNGFRDTEGVKLPQQMNSLLSLFDNCLSVYMKLELTVKYCT